MQRWSAVPPYTLKVKLLVAVEDQEFRWPFIFPGFALLPIDYRAGRSLRDISSWERRRSQSRLPEEALSRDSELTTRVMKLIGKGRH